MNDVSRDRPVRRGLPSAWAGARSWFSRWFASRRRLAGSITAYRVELDHRVAQCQARGEADLSWAEAARRLLEQSEQALNRGDTDAGWRSFHAAQRLELYGMTEQELSDRAAALAIEADSKLSGWRQRLVKELIRRADPDAARPDSPVGAPGAPPDPGGGPTPGAPPIAEGVAGAHAAGNSTAEPAPSGPDSNDLIARKAMADRIAYAALIRDDRFNNQYYQHSHFRYIAAILQAILAAVVISVILLVERIGSGEAPALKMDEDPMRFGESGHLLLIALFGAMGASFSAIIRLSQAAATATIPEQHVSGLLAILRPVLGAAAALGVAMLLTTGIFQQVFNIGTLTVGWVLAISFVAGFSERLVSSAVEVIERRFPESQADAVPPTAPVEPRARVGGSD